MVSFLEIQNWAKQIYDEDNGYFGGRTQDSWLGNGVKKTYEVLGKLFLDLNSDYKTVFTFWKFYKEVHFYCFSLSLCVLFFSEKNNKIIVAFIEEASDF